MSHAAMSRPPTALRTLLVAACAATLSATGGVRAQQLLAEFKQPGFFGTVGSVVGALGDITGDGRSELIVAGNVGAVVHSGADFTILYSAPFGWGELPIAINGVGDLDGDALPDFVALTAKSIRAFSGGDGHALWVVPPGFGSNYKAAVVGLDEDLDGDLWSDIAIAEYLVAPHGPQVRMLSGQTGATLLALPDTSFAIAAIEWDGTPGRELVLGEPNFSPHGGVPGPGRLRVIEPASGETLFSVLGGPMQGVGFAVAAPGDLNGDSVPDLVSSSQVVSGHMTAWSGATGGVLWNSNTFPHNLEPVGDVNGDGRSELVGAGPGGGAEGVGSGRLYDGATGASLLSLTSTELNGFFNIAAPGDLDGDGKPELLAGSAGGFSSSMQSARVIALPGGAELHLFSNPQGNALLGTAVDVVGDVDHDGRQDYVLGGAGTSIVYSGADGEALLQVSEPSAVSSFAPVAPHGCGDLDGDGTPDLALGNGSWGLSLFSADGRVSTYSGADGALLHSVQGGPQEQLGLALADVPDRDGDGVRDLLVTAPGANVGPVQKAGVVKLMSGATLQVLQTWDATPVANAGFGIAIAAGDGPGSDLDGDGITDFCVAGSAGGVGKLWVLSGASDTTLFEVTASVGAIRGDIVGDADGDGVDDVASREPGFNLPPFDPLVQRGRVRLWSGATGHLLWTVEGTVPFGALGFYGGPVGDVNGDGYADVAAGTRPNGALVMTGTLWICSGLDGELLDQIVLPSTGPSGTLGGVVGAGHVDAGGCSDVLVGLPALGNNGGAQIHSSAEGGVHGFVDLGFAKAGAVGNVPLLKGYGDLQANGLVSLRTWHAKPGAAGFWFISLTQGNLPFKQGTLVPTPGPLFLGVALAADAEGAFDITAFNPPGVFAGLALVHQFWFLDAGAPANVAATNGLREIFK